ncbi:MAG: hypothetical protein ACRDY3_12775, partial [Acidimicrobiales bacterium]
MVAVRLAPWCPPAACCSCPGAGALPGSLEDLLDRTIGDAEPGSTDERSVAGVRGAPGAVPNWTGPIPGRRDHPATGAPRSP